MFNKKVSKLTNQDALEWVKELKTISAHEQKCIDLISKSLDNEWVDVKDRLPSEYGEYWITDKNGSVGKDYWEQLTDYYEHENFDCWAFSDDDEVIAWKKVEPYERNE